MNGYEVLKLSNQLCFPLYALSKEIVRKYKPFLDYVGLTYTQYLVMLVLWEKDGYNVQDLGKILYLDSGTLTPLLKKLETKGYIKKEINEKDNRNIMIYLTKKGKMLKDKSKAIPLEMKKCIPISNEDGVMLHNILYKVLNEMKGDEK